MRLKRLTHIFKEPRLLGNKALQTPWSLLLLHMQAGRSCITLVFALIRRTYILTTMILRIERLDLFCVDMHQSRRIRWRLSAVQSYDQQQQISQDSSTPSRLSKKNPRHKMHAFRLDDKTVHQRRDAKLSQ